MKLPDALPLISIRPHCIRSSLIVNQARLPFHNVHQVRYAQRIVSRADTISIRPVSAVDGHRPVKAWSRSKLDPSYRTYFADVLIADMTSRPKKPSEEQQSTWWFECRDRLIGLTNESNYELQKDYWYAIRVGCTMAVSDGLHPKEEADARLICARSKPKGFPPVYYTLHQQADALYILGRTELERHPRFHRMAWYILNIATELGQFDAALLLHRLERADSSLSAGPKARSMITQMALENREWRAVMAYAEMEVLDKPESKRNTESIIQTIALLRDLFLRKAQPSEEVTGGLDLELLSHPDALEEYAPVCRYLWRIIELGGDKASSRPESQKHTTDNDWREYAAAVYEDAMKHHNPRAMYKMTQLPKDLGYAETNRGTAQRKGMLQQASSAVPEASYVLAKELCEEHSLLPTRRARERAKMQSPEQDSSSLSPIETDSVQHMVKTAEMYHGNDVTTEAYLYLLAVGLYHDNGLFEQGRVTAETAMSKLQEPVNHPHEASLTWIKLFEGLLKHWDSYQANGLYTDVRPENVMQRLDRIILNHTNED